VLARVNEGVPAIKAGDRQYVIPKQFGVMDLLVADFAHPCAFATNGIGRPSPEPSTRRVPVEHVSSDASASPDAI
jgi:hypothetical protein